MLFSEIVPDDYILLRNIQTTHDNVNFTFILRTLFSPFCFYSQQHWHCVRVMCWNPTSHILFCSPPLIDLQWYFQNFSQHTPRQKNHTWFLHWENTASRHLLDGMKSLPWSSQCYWFMEDHDQDTKYWATNTVPVFYHNAITLLSSLARVLRSTRQQCVLHTIPTL